MKNAQQENIRIPGLPRNKPQTLKIPDCPTDNLWEKLEFLISKDTKGKKHPWFINLLRKEVSSRKLEFPKHLQK